jgi:heterodisulfide reductase subunit A2
MSKVGVFVCHCGENISATVDCAKVAETAGNYEGVAYSIDYKYMCSDPGQNLIKSAIKDKGLDGIVVASCSPRMHEPTFRKACAEAGLNPFMCEMANLREHCSWVHEKGEATTEKAIDLVRILVEKVKYNHALSEIKVPVTKTALVIGGGIAGIQASLDIANTGHKVILIEKDPSIGGHMSQLSETFPTLDCSQCILTPRMVEVAQHPNITLYTYSELESLEGFIGNFKAKIRRKSKSLDEKLCTGCGLCTTKCPVKKIPSEFNEGLGKRTAIYVPFPQAVPNKPVIDRKNCTYYIKGKCKVCEVVCPTGAIRFDQEDQIMEVEIGAIVIATGFTVKQPDFFPEYGYGKYADVITGLQFERLASASGPTLGEIRRPSDGKVPEKIVFLACAGSRDHAKGIPYCSKICCMYIAKHAMLYQHKVHGGKSYVFYMDIRAGGKQYEEFVRRAIEDDGVNYVRGRVSRIYEKNGKLIVSGVDTLLNAMPVEI